MSFVWGVTLPEGEVVSEAAVSSNIENPVQTGEGTGGSEQQDICMVGGMCVPPDIYFLLVVLAMIVAIGITIKFMGKI